MKDLLAPLLLVAGTAAVRGQDQCTSKVCLFSDAEEKAAAYDWDESDILVAADSKMEWGHMKEIITDLDFGETVKVTLTTPYKPTPFTHKLHPDYYKEERKGNCFEMDEEGERITTYDQNITDYYIKA